MTSITDIAKILQLANIKVRRKGLRWLVINPGAYKAVQKVTQARLLSWSFRTISSRTQLCKIHITYFGLPGRPLVVSVWFKSCVRSKDRIPKIPIRPAATHTVVRSSDVKSCTPFEAKIAGRSLTFWASWSRYATVGHAVPVL